MIFFFFLETFLKLKNKKNKVFKTKDIWEVIIIKGF